MFELYARRDETRREHLAEIMTQLDLRPMREGDYRMCMRAAAACAVATEKGESIALAIVGALKAARIVVPGARLVERLALSGRAMARRQAYRHLIHDLGQANLTALDELLTERTGDRTLLGWIAEVPEGAKLKNLKGAIARLEVLRRVAIPDEQRKTIHANRYGVIAKEARILHAREMLRFSADRRYATLTAFVIERQAAITDLAIDLFDKLLGSARRKAETSRKERLLQEARILAGVALDHVQLGQTLMKARETGADLSAAIVGSIGWDGLETSVGIAEGVVRPAGSDEFDDLVDRQKSLRKLARLEVTLPGHSEAHGGFAIRDQIAALIWHCYHRQEGVGFRFDRLRQQPAGAIAQNQRQRIVDRVGLSKRGNGAIGSHRLIGAEPGLEPRPA